ncbi:hypothetical protein [Nocardia huaxiensis]|uniref:Uncharacterized protein n=1 Tax=Nocardia huaxiensis TaxID=2755382 RepID=A0A7D6ZHI6_9NOCA|nr:hypothetical protein [Nocardia huaxiensis]QLY29860.1 hypothetical protein H0264_32370 [Nocardia huaxiensis]UFS96552.1 hypothetical protein LPY97_01000 [Nocardia huaxiensis]
MVLGPGVTAQGEEPTRRMGVERLSGLFTVESWGALIPGKNGEFAVIPAE